MSGVKTRLACCVLALLLLLMPVACQDTDPSESGSSAAQESDPLVHGSDY